MDDQAETFQSTPSGGKATSYREFVSRANGVSIHAFRGEGDYYAILRFERVRRFNPRLPGGRRPCVVALLPVSSKFQSTPSGGKATLRIVRISENRRVSIHAFRGEGDNTPPANSHKNCRFNPRLPGGRRPIAKRAVSGTGWFQSTPSGGKATQP